MDHNVGRREKERTRADRKGGKDVIQGNRGGCKVRKT